MILESISFVVLVRMIEIQCDPVSQPRWFAGCGSLLISSLDLKASRVDTVFVCV